MTRSECVTNDGLFTLKTETLARCCGQTCRTQTSRTQTSRTQTSRSQTGSGCYPEKGAMPPVAKHQCKPEPAERLDEHQDHAHAQRFRARVVALLRRDVARARGRIEGRGLPKTLTLPVHQQLAARCGGAKGNKARIRADRGEDLQVEESKTVSRPSSNSAKSAVIAVPGAVRRLPPHLAAVDTPQRVVHLRGEVRRLGVGARPRAVMGTTGSRS
eukprot:scaffold21101_cov67-Phaeocystis_antarctica.AAC.2